MDDGFSGADFNRPDFKRMMNDVECGKVWAIAGAAVVAVMYLIFSPLGIGA
jgi:SSS family solute:Na+ symporter